MGLIVGSILGIIILASWAMNRRLKAELKKVSSTRKPLSKDSYIQILKDKGYDEQAITAVYEEIRSYLNDKNFSMYPEDDLYQLYGIDPEDLSDSIMEIFKKLKKELPSQIEIDKLNLEYKKSMNIEYVLKLTEVKPTV